MFTRLLYRSSRDNKIKEAVDALDFPFNDFTIESFVAHLERHLNRTIQLIPLTMPAGCYGAWLSDRDFPVEYVFFNDSLPLLHREHVQLHELGHIILGHETLKVSDRELSLLVSSESSDQVTGVLYRSQRRSDQEDGEAEEFAVLVQAHRGGSGQPPSSIASSSAEGRAYLKLFFKEADE